jgi:hypothetical protein
MAAKTRSSCGVRAAQSQGGVTKSTLYAICVLENRIEGFDDSSMQPLPILCRDTIDVVAAEFVWDASRDDLIDGDEAD